MPFSLRGVFVEPSLLLLILGNDFMERILTSILSFCVCADPIAQKVALTVVSKIVPSFSFAEPSWEKAVITVLQARCSFLQ